MLARWFNSNNWGDALNPVLIKNLSGITPKRDDFSRFWRLKTLLRDKSSNKDIYLVVGSILHMADRDCIVWGSGFLSENHIFKEMPKKVHAVRGPMSRNILLKLGVECPKIYGDPALLYPIFYKPNIKKRYKLGIVPHFKDLDNPLVNKYRNEDNVLIINVEENINKVVDDICSCELIASSSLHGIIASDAYNIPSTWIKFSDNVIGKGFKFRDYFASVGRKDKNPLIINSETNIQSILNQFYDYKIEIDLNKLLNACPFRNIKTNQ